MLKKKPNQRESSLFHAVDRRKFGRSICFLCGKRLGSRNRSDEHVFPKWVLNRYSLWNQKLTIQNGTQIPYRSLTIPCCHDCNTIHLQPIEDRICRATLKGPKAVAAIDQQTLYLWLGKIFYGLLYKEQFLVKDRKSSERAAIVTKEQLKMFALHHLFLQAARIPFVFQPTIPASILIFKIAPPREIKLHWDFRDSIPLMTVSCRIGNVGILAALQDGGAQRDYNDVFWNLYRRHVLHPLQFTELTAAFFYSASLLNRTPKFMVIDSDKPVHVIHNALMGLSAKPIFDDWQQEDYAKFLAHMTGLPFEQLFFPPKAVHSWLHDTKGRIRPCRLSGPDTGRFNN